MSQATFSHQVTAAAPPAPVWAALQELDTWRSLARVDTASDEERDDAGNLRAFRWEAAIAGQRWEGSATFSEVRPEEHLRFDLGASEIDGNIVVDLAAAEEDGTSITATMEVAAVGPLAKMFWSALRPTLDRGLKARLEEFADRF